MKTFPFSIIAAGVIAPGAAFAQEPGGQPPGTMPYQHDGKKKIERSYFLEAWKAGDKDEDGMISKTEFGVLPRIQKLPEDKRDSLFARLDKNEDGKLDRRELGRLGKPQNEQDPRMPRLWELDEDKSGGVSLQEFKVGHFFGKLPPEKQEELFRRLDTNRDGVISPKDKPEHPFEPGGAERKQQGSPEKGKPHGLREGPRQIIRQLDKDGDGAVSFEEFRAGPMHKDLGEDEQEDRFEAMDRNHDKKLTAEDFPPQPPPDGEPKRPDQPELRR